VNIQFSTTGPHIHSNDSINKTMWTIVLAMLPATVAACIFFGLQSLYPIFGTALFATLIEWPLAPGRYSAKQPLGDGSAFVAGMILGLSLSPGAAWWIPPLGAFIMIVLGKQVFGGIGNNIFNPALVARAVLLLSWPRYITGWVTPFDGVTTATPLEGFETGLWSLFIGSVPGSLGETSVIALLIGALFLMWRGLINWKVPVSVLVGAIVAALLFGLDPVFTILSGSLMFGAVFMATDMVTSPTGKTAHIVFGFGCGFLTVFIRRFTHLPEGLTFAFLLMNGLAYLIDRIGADPIFGQVEERKRRFWRIVSLVGTAAIIAVAAGVSRSGHNALAPRFADATLRAAVQASYPTANRVIDLTSYDASVQRYRVYHDRALLGHFARTTVKGYGGDMDIAVTLTHEDVITGVALVRHQESPTLGSNIAAPSFLAHFTGFQPGNREKIPENIAALTGATVSSRALLSAVEQVLAAADPETARRAGPAVALPRVDDGTYRGSARGYQGNISVSVSVQGGAVSAIEVTSHNETVGIGTRAMETIIDNIIQTQSLGVDAVSGATGSSRGILAAVKAAIEASPEEGQ
jgi:RnfABCDGE-type electron transport complex D subunit